MTPVDDRLDAVIREAMAELAGAAPLPTPAAELEVRRGRGAVSRPLRGAMVAAALATAGLIAFVVGTGDSPTTTPPAATDAPVVTDPTASSLPLPTDVPTVDGGTATTEFLYAPMNLPAGWTLWDAGPIVTTTWTEDVTEQAFGVRDPATGKVERGILVTITGGERGVADADLTVRGQPGRWWPSVVPGIDSLGWQEGPRFVEVLPIGLTRDETGAMAEALQWRTDPAQGFEPASASLPLLDEQSRPKNSIHTAMVYRVSPPGGPEFDSDDVNLAVTMPANSTRIYVGDGFPGPLSRPQTMFFGQRDDTGTVTLDATPVTPNVSRAMPHGTLVVVGTSTEVALGVALQLVASVDETPTDEVLARMEAGRTVLGDLPVLASTTFIDPVATIDARGDDATDPTSLCLTVDGTVTCRLAFGLSPFVEPTATRATSIVADHRWYILGAQPASEPELQVIVWREGLGDPVDPGSVTPFAMSTSVVGDTRFWITEVPAGIDLVSVLVPTGDGLLWATTQPSTPVFTRPPW